MQCKLVIKRLPNYRQAINFNFVIKWPYVVANHLRTLIVAPVGIYLINIIGRHQIFYATKLFYDLQPAV